ncbi:HNH endonuclease [Bacillus sp. 1NLA3E]|uniref:HNH endonuclease n=1 Tax=Bacillus sp. 1NLA3E TaxID=666686 RepID=UPI0003121326|nr:HNH endonuclease [Bacillus sp. 1NLA3E]
MDNRISRYSMTMGECEITGNFLYANEVHCHHYFPVHLDGSDQFKNLRILHKDVHKLIHMTEKTTITILISNLGISGPTVQKINTYREKCGIEPIS